MRFLCRCFGSKKQNDVENDRQIAGNADANGGGAGALTKNDKRPRSEKHATINETSSHRWDGASSQVSGRSSVYFDPSEGDEWYNTPLGSSSFGVTHKIDGQYFFSAKDDPNVSAEAFEGTKMHPPLPTTVPGRIPRSPYQHEREGGNSARGTEKADQACTQATRQASKEMGESINMLLQELNIPNVREKGFPGELTEEELEAVKQFRTELQNRDPIYRQIVHALSSVEKEAYALCRFLRARKFDVEKVFELLDEAKVHYSKAKEAEFYPDLQAVLGFSRPIFLSQYPVVFSGNAKNGCPVTYFKLGSIRPEGIKCIMSVEHIDRFFWNDTMHVFPERLKEGKRLNPNFMRTENITIYDLKGVSRSQITSDTFDVIKAANQVTLSFPEKLHCLLIINAPSWFSLIWSVVKKMIDPCTASKIEVFSNIKSGAKRMEELVDKSQIPSNYGGEGPSLAEAASGGGTGDAVVVNELLNLTKNKNELSHTFDLETGKQMTVAVYTRCKTGAKAELLRSDTTVTQIEIVGHEEDTPYSRTIGAVVGPGSFTVKLKSNSEPGNFLLLGLS